MSDDSRAPQPRTAFRSGRPDSGLPGALPGHAPARRAGTPRGITTMANDSRSTTPVLDRIASPRDLKRLSARQLATLAAELRQELIGTVTQTGGHLGASLGTVELAIALHTVFNSPMDKLV